MTEHQIYLNGTSAELRDGSPFVLFFSYKINSFSATKGQNRCNFETAKGKNLKFKLELGRSTYETMFGQILGVIGYVIRISKPKKLKCELEVQTTLARKLIAEGEQNFRI